MDNVFFVSGIDTDAGKSFCTGWLAKKWNDMGYRTITQKLVQTGNSEISEDIECHRRIMGTGFSPEDTEKLTMPCIFSYPCSPHLASEIDGKILNLNKISEATNVLSTRYDRVLVEGAGGLMVPLTRDYLTIDYIKDMGLPLIFVTSGRLGSINHTLLSFEAIKNRNICLKSVLFNEFPKEEDHIICDDTKAYLRNVLAKEFPDTEYIEVPIIKNL